MKITAKDICDIVEGEIVGDPNVVISGPSKIEEGIKGTISFLANPKYNSYAYSTKASALLVAKDFIPMQEIKPTLIKVENVYTSLSKLLQSFEQKENSSGISDFAVISKSAILGEKTSVGVYTVISEGAVIGRDSQIGDQVSIGKNARIGNNTIIYPGVKIYQDCVIGDNCILHAGVVIGSDGFGFVPNKKGEYEKIPQIGNVIIEHNVEIGANTTIDRATMGSTIIKAGVKLDNLIQIAHNVVIGENTVIAAQTGIAGSTKVGKNCQIGGQVGMSGHIVIPDGTIIQGRAGVTSSPKNKGMQLYGTPAIEYRDFLKSYAHFKNLPEMEKKLKRLKNEIEDLKSSK